MLTEYKQPIPYCYTWMAAGNGKQFKAYVIGYVKHNYPGYELVRIEDKGKWVVIRKKD